MMLRNQERSGSDRRDISQVSFLDAYNFYNRPLPPTPFLFHSSLIDYLTLFLIYDAHVV